ncbi:metal-dependent amidase/aminoacylase/carboxypeptidase [Coniochaeta ligniaria NRRL 30616]|uniref:Metal-dependent amidase/aminoacylase/carboxypeptidase n=1 Tax=Coniochaeta ligniaria NRRL 30616 TaxID=1408157 RepID=A0A1J7JGJ0_9PEZI|nr:metal-dependent amidase/aminoacylase/carboxypeptidase [Coniochaeta ligniaria NRRL 30616]
MSHLVSKFRPDLGPYEDLYRQLHKDPELSWNEATTAATIADHLQSLPGIEVKTGIGGHGLVGILRNGHGPVVLLRSELDALPILEQTGLPFASNKRMPFEPGAPQEPVMHACGHDMHMTALLASAKLLHTTRLLWRGTVVFLFQPDEENGTGAKRMVDDGLYDAERHAVPRPDVVLGGHVMPMRAGSISTRPGIFNTTSESVRITLYGQGSHGAKPHKAVDPVVMACSTVMKLQTIVSREMDPSDTAVVTVGSVQAGKAPNVIPDQATLLVNIRAIKESSLQKVKDSVKRIVDAECVSFNSPKPPLIENITFFPLLNNDDAATAKVQQAMRDHFGADFSAEVPVSTGSEDIANLALPISAPVCFWNYGGTDPKIWDEAVRRGKVEEIPANHSAKYAPVIQPTLTVATDAYSLAALTFLTPQSP